MRCHRVPRGLGAVDVGPCPSGLGLEKGVRHSLRPEDRSWNMRGCRQKEALGTQLVADDGLT